MVLHKPYCSQLSSLLSLSCHILTAAQGLFAAVMGTAMLSGGKKKSGHAGRATELGFVPPLPSCSCSILSASLAAGAQLETRAPSPNPLHPSMLRAFTHFPAAGSKV